MKSKVWFVGMEEGLSPDEGLEFLKSRFLATDGKKVIDLRKNMSGMEKHSIWFKNNAPLQATWKFMIFFYLYLKNNTVPSKEDIRLYQIVRLGDEKFKETAILELMPLPSHKAHQNSWLYGDIGLPDIRTRSVYLKIHKPERVKNLQMIIKKYHPRLVVFYSLTYLSDWKDVVGIELKEITRKMYFTRSKYTAYCVLPHSTSHGMSYMRIQKFIDKVKNDLPIGSW